uniref:Uncharacterized protein n=1 Tax=Anguilla anguilla TaxID=7936 RepID=A0A0E9RFP5_ANGAN
MRNENALDLEKKNTRTLGIIIIDCNAGDSTKLKVGRMFF